MDIKRLRQGIGETGLCGPLLTVVMALLMFMYLRYFNPMPFAMNGQGFGPTSWPQFMILGVIVSAGLICTCRARACLLRKRATAPDRSATTAPSNHCDNVMLFVGSWAVVLYGIGIVQIGFAFSTLAFLVLWFLLGGTRKPSTVISVGALGTISTLYLFIMVAYMPLPRGFGVFDELTVRLYELLGIY